MLECLKETRNFFYQSPWQEKIFLLERYKQKNKSAQIYASQPNGWKIKKSAKTQGDLTHVFFLNEMPKSKTKSTAS